MLLARSLAGLLFLVPFISRVSIANEVSREAPVEWKTFENELASWQDLLELPEVKTDSRRDDPEVELLCRDTYYQVRKDGSHLVVSHIVKQLLKDSGQQDFSTETIQFRPSTTKIHVEVARTILPDGRELEVEDKAVFVEEVKSNSDILFDDRKKLRVVFPDTQVGALVEIVYVREVVPLVEGFFSTTQPWNWYYPSRQRKLVFDFPSELIGDVVWEQKQIEPVVERLNPWNGWHRLQWTQQGVVPLYFEPGMPSILQRGPFVRVGLDERWDQFGEWFGRLIADGGKSRKFELPEAVRSSSEEPFELADQLLQYVSREIRYTGLEFGDGAYEPRSVEEVLRTRYGDCKDKANLLRVLLKLYDIPSRIGLLNSMLPGEISRKIASPGHFDHAILAVDLPGANSPVFCDPTNPGIPLGLISPRDQGKDVLLVDESGDIEWSSLPKAEVAREILEADLRLEPTGGFAGWFTVKATGSAGHYLKHYFSKLDRDRRGSEAVASVFRYVNGIWIVDSEEVEDPEFPFHYRFYTVQSVNSVEISEKTARFALPISERVVTRVGPEGGIREHPFLMTPAKVENRLTLRLPKSWEVLDLPKNFHDRGQGYVIRGEWTEAEEGVLKAEVSMERTNREFSSREFSIFGDSVRSFAKWFSTSALLQKGGRQDENWVPNPKRLPKMPSSEGYTVLINTRFPFDPQSPYDADHRSRQAAFKRMRDLYPESDHDAQFTSRHMENASRLFSSYGEETLEIVDEMRKVIDDYSGKVEAQKIASSEIVLAAALYEVGEVESAKSICLDILDMEGLPEILPQGAASIVASVLCFEDPAAAADYGRLALRNPFLSELEWQEVANILIFGEIAKSDDATSMASRLDEVLSWIEETFPERSEGAYEDLTFIPEFAVYGGYQTVGKQMSLLLRRQSEKYQLSRVDKRRLRQWEERLAKVEPLHAQLQEYLLDNPWPNSETDGEGAWIRSAVDCYELYLDEPELEFRYLVRGLSDFGPQPDWCERAQELHAVARVWMRQAKAGKADKIPDGFEALILLVNQLWKEAPATDYSEPETAYRSELSFLKDWKGIDAAETYAENHINDPATPEIARAWIARELSKYRKDADDVSGYLDAVQLIGMLDVEANWKANILRDGGYVALAAGDYDRAIDLLAAVEQIGENPEGGELNQQTLRIQSIVDGLQTNSQWWSESEEWWPEWLKLSQSLGLEIEQEPWSAVDAWKRPSEKRLEKVLRLEGDARGNAVKKLFPRIWKYLRFHPCESGGLIDFVRSTADAFPEHLEDIEGLVNRVDLDQGLSVP